LNPVTNLETPPRRLSAFLERHGDLFWWLHSVWALLIGAGMMWLGSRHYGLLRIAVFQIAFIWIASLIVPALVNRPPESSRWAHRTRLVINYFSRNFYQQLLFLLLPIYYASATAWSWNMLFVAFVAVSALLSTLDVVYDRHLSVRRSLMAVFFAFNLFACINVMLPLVWRISNAAGMRASAVLALVAFVTILFGRRRLLAPLTWVIVVASAGVLLVTVEFGRPLIPPAPLRLVSYSFGSALNARALRMTRAIDRVDPGWSGRLYALTAIYAPMGLEDRVAHRWYENGRLVYTSPFHKLVGGRKEGFRLWTSFPLVRVPGGRLRVDIETEAGQLIGRCEVTVEPATLPAGDITLPVPF
jgi:hypothetical protein